MTDALLPKAASVLENLSWEQLNDDLNRLMAHDPTQSHNHKDLAKIIGAPAHNLIVQTRLSESNVTYLEQEAAALKLQAEEAWRNQAHAQNRLDQLTLEAQDQHRRVDYKDPEIQKKKWKNFADLHVNTEHQQRLEQEAREELSGKLQQAEAFLVRAETELKERDAKAYEGHLQTDRGGIQAPTHQRDHLKDKLDIVQRELKYANKLQSDLKGETHHIISP